MKKFKYLFLSAFLIVSFESFSAEYGYVDDETRIQLVRMNQLMPEYPRQAIRLGIEGSVVLKFNVDEYGAVLDPYVVESNPGGIFDRASIKAVRKLIYEPPLFEEKSPSRRFSIKKASPNLQSCNIFFVKNIATTILNLLCIHPSAVSCLMAESIIGNPVLPVFHASNSFLSNLHLIFFV